MTPMQEQYEKIKGEYKDHIVFFRLGDFYEAFDNDAVQLSNILGITLTGRGKDEKRRPMAGIPFHALDNYLPKLLDAGCKVAIADQVEEATPGKLVERKVTKIITPGTITDEESLQSDKNNYLGALHLNKDTYYLSYLDVNGSEVSIVEAKNIHDVINEVKRLNIKELVILDKSSFKEELIKQGVYINELPKRFFDESSNKKCVLNIFKISTLGGFGLNDTEDEYISLGAVLRYVQECLRTDPSNLIRIQKIIQTDYLKIDVNTIRNLELFYNSLGLETPTLNSVLNKCVNPVGKRIMRTWILRPIVDVAKLNRRYEKVAYFKECRFECEELQEILKSISDLERINSRISLMSANPRDLLSLKYSLQMFLQLEDSIRSNSEMFQEYLAIFEKRSDIQNVIDLIESSINEESSIEITNGDVFKLGYDSAIDELKGISKNSKDVLSKIQIREVERTGISSLKVAFNSVFGYYIEVTRSNLDKVPNDYIRKQTLANAERYITEELKEWEEKILTANDKLIKLEVEAFQKILEELGKSKLLIGEVTHVVAELDIFSSLGKLARERNYVQPEINLNSNDDSKIVEGRHPVIEDIIKEFIPNNFEIVNGKLINIITGPNMSGKSTFIRQVALIYLMAQIGSFVPASQFKYAPVDKIYSRVGASDNLSKGESTFMVEMIETANILNNATKNSLVILDEVGRGTSTYDGVAIAWSMVEFLSDKIKPITLFATHYHELTEMDKIKSNIKNLSVEVYDDGKDIVFTHKIKEGKANKSYGIHVAELAGVPKVVVKRAQEILKKFEAQPKSKNAPQKPDTEQLGLL
jgi:DNA mismatch repair protein MutS